MMFCLREHPIPAGGAWATALQLRIRRLWPETARVLKAADLPFWCQPYEGSEVSFIATTSGVGRKRTVAVLSIFDANQQSEKVSILVCNTRLFDPDRVIVRYTADLATVSRTGRTQVVQLLAWLVRQFQSGCTPEKLGNWDGKKKAQTDGACVPYQTIRYLQTEFRSGHTGEVSVVKAIMATGRREIDAAKMLVKLQTAPFFLPPEVLNLDQYPKYAQRRGVLEFERVYSGP